MRDLDLVFESLPTYQEHRKWTKRLEYRPLRFSPLWALLMGKMWVWRLSCIVLEYHLNMQVPLFLPSPDKLLSNWVFLGPGTKPPSNLHYRQALGIFLESIYFRFLKNLFRLFEHRRRNLAKLMWENRAHTRSDQVWLAKKREAKTSDDVVNLAQYA